VARSSGVNETECIPARKLMAGQELRLNEADLLHLSTFASPLEFCLEDGDAMLTMSLQEHQGVLLACAKDARLCVLGGQVELRRLGVINFAKLLAFIDAVEIDVAGDVTDDRTVVALDLAPQSVVDQRALEYWFIRQVIEGDAAFAALTGFLRRLEAYWLIKYLVSEAAQQKKVSTLGEEYGLSYSHFRRVCKAALGNSVKSELKVWRAARSLLEVVAGEETMTEVAIRNGYASSSHFSTEIKQLFGLSPRAIMELNL